MFHSSVKLDNLLLDRPLRPSTLQGQPPPRLSIADWAFALQLPDSSAMVQTTYRFNPFSLHLLACLSGAWPAAYSCCNGAHPHLQHSLKLSSMQGLETVFHMSLTELTVLGSIYALQARLLAF